MNLIKNIAAFTMFVMSSTTNAALLTSNDIIGSTLVDFSPLVTVHESPGPLQVGDSAGEDITVSGSPNSGIYINLGGWAVGDNGFWIDRPLIGANDAFPGSLIFSFNDGPVSSVGGFMNHSPNRGTDLVISAFDTGMNLLESYNITALANIDTPNATNGGGFRGIDMGVDVISFFEVSGITPVVGELSFYRDVSAVPVPASIWLFCSGLIGLIGMRKRQQ